MSTNVRLRCRVVYALVALSLCVGGTPVLAGQGVVSTKEQADDAAAFKGFSTRVQTYLKLRKTVESGLPALKSTDAPELIAAHQQALAKKLQEARPDARAGDIFTPAACEAFRRASLATLGGAQSAKSRAYMQRDAPDPDMPLAVNGIYPDTEPTTAFPPGLLAAFPALPIEIAYRVVGRTLIVIDVKSRLIVDVAPLILPAS